MDKLLVVLLLVLFISCQKAQRDEDTAVNTCEDISLAMTAFTDAYKQMRIAAHSAEGIYVDADSTASTIYGCESITVDTLSNPKTITINYKFLGCEGLGVERYGRLIGEFSGPFGEENSALDITFSNYFFKEFEVNGDIRVIFNSRNASDQEVHTFYLQNGSINDGENILNWTASQTWTVDASDEIEQFSLSGNSNGQNRKGNVFLSEITSGVGLSADCVYPASGRHEVNVRNLSLRRLDYGNGTCNNQAQATINGATFNVTIP